MWEYIPLITQGLYGTLTIFSFVLVLSLPLGFIITLLRVSRFKPLQWITGFYIYIMRGTPLLLQLLFFFYGVARILPMSREAVAILAFVLNYAAYFAEIFRGGLLSIDKGQLEAAKVLGLTRFQAITKIVVPQMLKVTLPPLSNESITLVKDTALIFSVGLTDILSLTKNAVSNSVTFLPYIYAAILYLALTYILTVIFKAFEKRYMFE